jgi:hypothetical protein
MTDQELDRAVAEEVMGCRVQVSANGKLSELGGGEERVYKDAQIPRFSTDIAAAWQVVEKMREYGWSVTIGQHIDLSWRCKFTNDEILIEVIARANTAPRAICETALEAVRAHK